MWVVLFLGRSEVSGPGRHGNRIIIGVLERLVKERARRGPGEERQPVFCLLGTQRGGPREERPNRE